MDENTQFRRALRNPFVMMGLCILAGLAMYHNVMESPLNSALPHSIDLALQPSESTPTVTPSSSSVVNDEERSRWIKRPKRDPFTPTSIAKSSTPTPGQREVSRLPSQKPNPASLKKLVLKAVAIESQQRSAVINRQIVYEGEMIEGYQVVSIQLKGVWLSRHGKKKFLTFTSNTLS